MNSSSLRNLSLFFRSLIRWNSVPPAQYSITRQGMPWCLKWPLKDTMLGCFFSSALCSTSISLSTSSKCRACAFCKRISLMATTSSWKKRTDIKSNAVSNTKVIQTRTRSTNITWQKNFLQRLAMKNEIPCFHN